MSLVHVLDDIVMYPNLQICNNRDYTAVVALTIGSRHVLIILSARRHKLCAAMQSSVHLHFAAFVVNRSVTAGKK